MSKKLKAVEPIRSLKAISNIKNRLRVNNTRDYCLFVMGIKTGLRCNELLDIKTEAVKYLKEGDELTIQESKTGKTKTVILNSEVVEAIDIYLREFTRAEVHTRYLFGGKGKTGKMAVQSVIRLCHSWFDAEPLLVKEMKRGKRYGSHTMRKTFGYQSRKAGVDLAVMTKTLGHSSQSQTLDYLGIDDDEINAVYKLNW